MPEVPCKQCGKNFNAKPFYRKRGYGLFCSRACYYASVQKGKIVRCEVCHAEIYRGLKQLAHSKSKKFFCSKSCQTIWRNQQYVGDKHKLWKGGWNVQYREILLASGKKPICLLCKEEDKRIIVVHHADENRSKDGDYSLVEKHLLVEQNSRVRFSLVAPK